jgi:hypothetical protein
MSIEKPGFQPAPEEMGHFRSESKTIHPLYASAEQSQPVVEQAGVANLEKEVFKVLSVRERVETTIAVSPRLIKEFIRIKKGELSLSRGDARAARLGSQEPQALSINQIVAHQTQEAIEGYAGILSSQERKQLIKAAFDQAIAEAVAELEQNPEQLAKFIRTQDEVQAFTYERTQPEAQAKELGLIREVGVILRNAREAVSRAPEGKKAEAWSEAVRAHYLGKLLRWEMRPWQKNIVNDLFDKNGVKINEAIRVSQDQAELASLFKQVIDHRLRIFTT